MVKQIEIRGRFLPILKWTVVLVIAVFAVSILIVWLTDDGTNREVMRTSDMIQLFIPIFGWIAVGVFGFSVFMYAISWYARVRINEYEISGRTYGGLKVSFPSQSVTTVTATRYQGVPTDFI